MMMLNSKFVLRRAFQCALLVPLIVVLLGAGEPDARFKAIGHRLVCICGACGELLLECNHVGCTYSDRMRSELMDGITRGDNDSLIEQAFVQKYGPTVLAAPTTSGFDRTAWVFPFVAFVFGVIGVVMVVRAWKNRPTAVPAGGVPRIANSELDKFREQAREETDL